MASLALLSRQALVPVAQHALTTTSTKAALTGGMDVIAGGTRELQTLLRGTAAELETKTLQHTRKTIAELGLISTKCALGWTFGSGLAGLLGGFVVGGVTQSMTVWMSIFGGLTAVGAAVVPTAMALKKAADVQERIARERMIELPDLRPPIERFREADGVAKVHLGLELRKLRDILEAKRLLAPEARAALNGAVKEADGLPEELRHSAERLSRLAQVLARPIDRSGFHVIRTELSGAPAAEQAELATALRDLIFSDRKRLARLDYEVRNDLHDLLTTHEQVNR